VLEDLDKEMNEQAIEKARVSAAISQHVAAFLDRNLNREFHNGDLHDYVNQRVTIAPGSADRIMRDLRAKGRVNYKVINRRQSLYLSLPVKGQMELFQ
jgi:ribosomal protein S25